jgi:O-antigen ligase
MPITAIIFLVLFFFGIFLALKKPIYGLHLYFFIFYIHPPGKYWGSFLPEIRWSLIVALVTLISTLIWEKDKFKWVKFKESKLFIIFYIFLLLQLSWALSFDLQLYYVSLFGKFLLLYALMCIIIKTEKDIVSIIVTNLLGCAYMGWLALSMHSGGRFETVGSPALTGANLMGMHVASILITAALILLCKYNKKQFLVLIPLPLVLNLVLLTQSRGALLALSVSGLFLYIFATKEIRKPLKFYGMCGILSIAFLIGPDMLERINQASGADEAKDMDKSAYSRIVVVESQLKMFTENPFWGHGHRGTLILSPLFVSEEYMTKAKGTGDSVRASHNLTMAILVDHGLIGFFFYFGVFYLCLKKIRLVRENPERDKNLKLILLGFIAALVCMLTASQFSNSKVLEITVWLIALIVKTTEQINATSSDENSKTNL